LGKRGGVPVSGRARAHGKQFKVRQGRNALCGGTAGGRRGARDHDSDHDSNHGSNVNRVTEPTDIV
jgi:hypothetical protein